MEPSQSATPPPPYKRQPSPAPMPGRRSQNNNRAVDMDVDVDFGGVGVDSAGTATERVAEKEKWTEEKERAREGEKYAAREKPRPLIVTHAASMDGIERMVRERGAVVGMGSGTRTGGKTEGELEGGAGSGSTSRLQVPSEQEARHSGAEGEVTAEKETEIGRPPSFAPYFTLVNDLAAGTGGGGTYHPNRVHYLFSDDDASGVLTEALIRSASSPAHSYSNRNFDLEEDESGIESSSLIKTTGTGTETGTGTSSSSSSATFRRDGSLKEREYHYKNGRNGKGREKRKEKEKGIAKGVTKEREERIIIVDINAAGDGVQSISSLSSSWQVLSAEIVNAPTWDGADPSDGDEVSPKGLLLKIEGISVPISGEVAGKEKEREGLGIVTGGEVGAGGREKEKEIGDEEMQALLEGFDNKMRLLRSVVGGRSRVNSRESGRSD